MELWYPDAEKVIPRDRLGGVINTLFPAKGLLHTTESKVYVPRTTDYYGHQYWPNATVEEGVYQHFPLDRAGYALKANDDDNVFQIEIAWVASEIRLLPMRMQILLRDLIRWVSEQKRIPMVYPQFVPYPRSYGEDAPQRFGLSYWNRFSGWCGHQHAPKPDNHGDPGDIPTSVIFALDRESSSVNDHLKFYQARNAEGGPVGPVYKVNLIDGTADGAEPGTFSDHAVREDLKRTAGVDDTVYLVDPTTLKQFKIVG